MKKLEYAAGVTSIYRKYLDLYEESPESYKVEEADMERLLLLGNRNGFTKGYYEMRNGRSMMTLTDSSHSSNDGLSAGSGTETSGANASCLSCRSADGVICDTSGW